MTDAIYFDTDCLSSFFCVSRESLLATLYPMRLFIPGFVRREFHDSRNRKLIDHLEALISNSILQVTEISATPDYLKLFIKLTTNPEDGFTFIGRGEAAAITLAVINGATLASDNLSDVKQYVNHYNLNHKKTTDILCEAFDSGLIREVDGNDIYRNMLINGRKLPPGTFSDLLAKRQ